jgi:hypothetical protein
MTMMLGPSKAVLSGEAAIPEQGHDHATPDGVDPPDVPDEVETPAAEAAAASAAVETAPSENGASVDSEPAKS